ncbi:tetratricopeptide repeat protein [Chitinophaga sp. 30R24]|uniref:tetratricopeptide repeat protein n=1 Tax=Chitinophaga sp. 30R24 TaxID=3248838 RepID=UPI003B903763
MRYIANIIPAASKVLPDYFKGNPEKIKSISTKTQWASYTIAIIFFLFAFGTLYHPLLSLLAAAMGLGLLPSVHRWLEKKLKFDYTTSVKLKAYVILTIPLLLLTGYYGKTDTKLAHEYFLKEEQIKREQAIAAVKDSVRRDSLYTYISLLQHKQKQGNLSSKEAVAILEKSLLLAESEGEKRDVSNIKFDIDKENTLRLVKEGKYQPAVQPLTELLSQSPEDAILLYNRALCYDRLGEPEGAVRDLQLAMKAGSKEAEKYHDKINPVRKKVIGYVTRCCDGTTSSASGRGACSWHGGVCNWNDPIYETYRKYE